MIRQPCYKDCPEGFTPVKTIDAIGDKKFAVLMNVFGFLIAIAVGFISCFLKFGFQKSLTSFSAYLPSGDPQDSLLRTLWKTEAPLLLLIVLMIAYMALHELVHGIAYKILTGAKLKFGISLSCAYCGVPDVYVNKKTALISLLAPFTVFSVIFILFIIFTDGIVALGAIILFASHIGGCAGDLYDSILLLFRYKGEVWMNDNGPRQVFCQKNK